MIVIDTHVWLWWAFRPNKLTLAQSTALHEHRSSGIGVCSITCWEVAMLASRNRINLGLPTEEWLDDALNFPGVVWLPMTPTIAVAANQLPESFHRDPVDRIIVPTAQSLDCALVTSDQEIQEYPHVRTIR